MTENAEPAQRRSCPWCSASAAPDATHCAACGAALAQRESIGDLVIPGVTTVDPALQAYAAQPLRIPGNSPSQGIAGGAVAAAAAIGGPAGLAALGGLAAVAAAEYLGAGRGGSGDAVALADVGRPSDAVLQALERLDRETSEPPASPGPGYASAGDASRERASAGEDGSPRDRQPWPPGGAHRDR